jgi:hypothetical protein
MIKPVCFHSYMILTLLSIHIPPGVTEEPSIMYKAESQGILRGSKSLHNINWINISFTSLPIEDIFAVYLQTK